ncbi:hypothetical protein A2U01_0012239, partial [Trifolium medium]|nr:hypothetical protein [Trifolium medium]
GTSNSGRNVRHVESFGDSDASEEEQNDLHVEVEDTGYAVVKKKP